MQKKRSRKNGTATDGPAPAGRRVHVRSRLVVGVAVASLTVLAAGAPAVVTATRELNDSQQLVTLAQQTQHTLTLAHLLGDERDAVVEYVAKGRPGAQAKAPLQERTALTDRQLDEVRAEADEPLAKALARVRAARTEAVDGKGSAVAAHQAYADVIAELLAPGVRLADQTPPRAEDALATTRPLAPLGQAVEQASATRGLLLAALAVPRADQAPNTAVADELSAAAQRARVREQAALDDFTRTARPEVRQTLAATVTGPEVKTADDYLKRLTERSTLSAADRKLDAAAVGSALTARIDRMRSVEATLAGQRATALATLRNDDVTRLEMLVAALGVLFLVTVGVSTAVARSLTRPLSVLRRGAARLATPEGSVEPVRFTGRNDEFAEVVRHLNAVRDQTVSLHTKIAGLDADRKRLIGRNEALSAGRDALESELTELREALEEHRRVMARTSVSLSLRTLGLVERQLAVIEELEAKEQDPDRLETLFRLDHLATVMRRHNENLLVLAGQEHGQGADTPVPLVDVMRAAVSEIERYERVDLAVPPSFTQVAGHAADDVSHVLAELLENATTFSPPGAKVKLCARHLESGDVVLSVVDEGIGVTPDRLAALNARLATPGAYDEESEAEHGLGLGLYVAGRLAARHGVTAELHASQSGGIEGLIAIPAALLPDGPPTSPVHTFATPGLPRFQLPGVVAEANENTLPPRIRPAGEPADADAAPAADADSAPAAAATPVFDGPASDTTAFDAPADAFGAAPGAGTDADAPAADAGPGADLPEAAAGDQAPADSAGPAGFGGGTTPDGEPLPPAEQVSTAQAPEASPDPAPGAAPTPGATPAVAATPMTLHERAAREEVPPADEVFTAQAPTDPDAGDELLARVVPDAEPGAFAVPEHTGPAAAGAPEGTAQPVDVPETSSTPPEQAATPAAPDAERQPPADRVSTARGAAPAEPHGHTPAETDWVPRQGSHADHDGPRDTVTAKGLPKRTPRTLAGRAFPGSTAGFAAGPGPAAPVPAPGAGTTPPAPRRVDAEELRRRLGGFYQGTRDGRRVVAAELAQDTDQGDTAQEART
ncbi:nitrate- and nitrite sensing domain-containing protein [Streptomyces sp. BR123]|uniref:sensor histidine kinase n=1 Tax=Streptomyces sp. BR123 TaxID=2749828 RepID=UPI0015C4384C|nr:nitrate- and nitrite sensing domain-containing protein [Streptomyces sp. BR123]NXY96304.1 nitrate- and nitrite sensing domain-containing protein [Streptomyces sp. BR123]